MLEDLEKKDSSIGELLAEQRRIKGISPKDVEKYIKVRAKYISALEKDEYSTIPGHAYVIGFIKTYADFLGIGSKDLIDRYKTEHETEIQKASPFVIGDTEKRQGRGLARVLFVLIVAIGLIYLFIRSETISNIF